MEKAKEFGAKITDESFKDYILRKNIKRWFGDIDGKQIILPDRFLPKKEFLEYHNKNIFENFE
jgi:hypothetical protein